MYVPIHYCCPNIRTKFTVISSSWHKVFHMVSFTTVEEDSNVQTYIKGASKRLVAASHLVCHLRLFLALSQEMSPFSHHSTHTSCFRPPLLPLLLRCGGRLSPEWHLSHVTSESHPQFTKSVTVPLICIYPLLICQLSVSMQAFVNARIENVH